MIKRYRGCTAASLSCIIYKRVKLISTREADEAWVKIILSRTRSFWIEANQRRVFPFFLNQIHVYLSSRKSNALWKEKNNLKLRTNKKILQNYARKRRADYNLERWRADRNIWLLDQVVVGFTTSQLTRNTALLCGSLLFPCSFACEYAMFQQEIQQRWSASVDARARHYPHLINYR